jgi:hypothetical protein
MARSRATRALAIALCLKYKEARRQSDERLLFIGGKAPFCKRDRR